MKIDDSFNKTGPVGVSSTPAKASASKGAEKTAAVSTASTSDSVKISAQAQALGGSSTFDAKKVNEIKAAIASGSFQSDGMIIAPCSMKTLASVAMGMSDNLITRAADVVLKERRRLVLMVRETPFNLAHLRNMTSVTEMGGIIFPPLPGFYQRPASIAEMVDHTVGRVLDMVSVSHQMTPRWGGLKAANGSPAG